MAVSTLPLTLLSAPAGYGKSTALAALPHLLPDVPLAWVTLDEEENDPIRFLGLLTTALQRLHPDCGRSVWPWLSGGVADVADLKRAVGALVNEVLACLPSPFILVLDDLHFVTEPSVYVALEYLLDHQPPQMHLAVGTRHDPPLRLVRLAARRQLAELRRLDLGFSLEEANQLLNSALGLHLSPAEVSALQERTEGWPAGLCLLAGPLSRLASPADRSQFLSTVAHSERYALDFLAEEVLRDLPADLRLFLLQTAVLTEMTPTVCRAVTGREDAGDVLEALYRRNLTIASITAEAAGEPVYRHHALFARLLTRLLEQEMPDAVVELHRRAALAQRTTGRAIYHYLAAGLWEPAAEVMAQSGMELLHRGMSETIRSWHSALPAQTRASHPRLAVLMARCEIQSGNYPAARQMLEQARATLVAAGDQQGEGEALASLLTLTIQNDDRQAAAELVMRAQELPMVPPGQVAVSLARAWLLASAGDWAAAQTCMREALSIPPATGSRVAAFLGVTYLCASLVGVPGGLELVERYCAETTTLALPESALRLGIDEMHLWTLVLRGQTEDALALAEAAEGLRQRQGGWPVLGNDVALLLAVLQMARARPDAARQAAETLLRRLERAPRSRLNLYLHGAGRTLALVGQPDQAEQVCQRLATLADGLPLTQYLCDHLAGLIALIGGRPAAAAAPLARAAALEAHLPTARGGGSARLLQANLLLAQGQPDAALETLAPVLTGWELAGTYGCALLDGPVGAPALRLAAQRGSGCAARALALIAQPVALPLTAAGPATLTEPLTQRECDVLRQLVAGRTNRQIGEALYISEETVKSHVAHILRKLDVTSRTQAALRGRQLGY